MARLDRGRRDFVAREQRKLAAILAADVVGYSRLMGRDESGTLARLRKNRSQYLDPVLAKYGGRLVKLTGDGALVEFASAVDALSAAIEFQQAMAEANGDAPADNALVFRMGLHLGDLIVDGDDLYGDGVNIAARLEAEAPAGGIVISRTVHEAVTGRLKATFDDLGSLALKNIERPVTAYGVKWEALDWQLPLTPEVAITSPTAPQTLLPLPDKPSIAVLPFQNMSGDPEQDYFADGVVEDVIAGLSRNKGLFVIARNSSFAYKGKSPDIRQVGRELGVRYVLEGSVRKAGNRVRITGQLIEAASGAHLWADRFEGNLEDIFALQDQVTSRVIGGIAPTLELAEVERVKRKIGNLQAYDCYLRSMAAIYRFSREANEKALSHGRQAVALEPEFARGHMAIAHTLNQRWAFRWIVDDAAEAQQAERAIRRAIDLDRHDARILAVCGQATIVVLRRIKEGAEYLDEAVSLDPNSAQAWTYHANAQIIRNEPLKAIGDLEQVLRLSPLDPFKFYTLTLMARAHTLSGQYSEALRFAASALMVRPNFPHALIEEIVVNVLAGRLDTAREALASFRKLQPEDRVSIYNPPHLPASGIAKYREALRLAGLPD
jgi:TolB-like protein/class 3 adenylate cyclase